MANIISLIQDPNNHNNQNLKPTLPIPISIPIPIPIPSKRKRSLPGAPDPDSEVVVLSPKSLMATNRFVCEVCRKGFQRDQNLQLHRRGHNLPWKLKRSDKEAITKKKVYVCPENTCVHHHPSRALGDLTGIKKHYSRKHGEKKWMCLKCSKKYAVQSDLKAHGKICGTKEYKCYCGTIFSRKDSFTTHRAFCEALKTLPPPLNLNYRTADELLLDQSCLLNWTNKQFKIPLEYHHGIGNYYSHELIDHNPVNNYWSSFPMSMAQKVEEDCKGFSSNTLRAAVCAEENGYYYGNEQTGILQMGSSSTTTTTTHDDHQNINLFCNGGGGGNINGGDHEEQENLNLLTGNNNNMTMMMMMGKGDYKNININGGLQDEFVFGGDHHHHHHHDHCTSNSNPFHAMIHETVDRNTTRDFLGSGGWSTFDMAKIGSLGAASAMTNGHCSSL